MDPLEKHPDLMGFEDPDFSNPKLIDRPPFRRRRSPIIITLSDPKITHVDIQKMMEIGMNVARLKTSRSTKGDKIKLLGKVDKAAAFLSHKYGLLDWPVATCVELKTCIVKTGILDEEEGDINLKDGAYVILTYNLTEYDKCNERKIFVDNPYLATDVKIGMEISIAEEEIILHCEEIIDSKSIRCVVSKGGTLSNMCNVSMRGSKSSRPYLTKKDLQIVKFALEYQVDMIFINYARHVNTIKKVKQYIGRKMKRPVIICGICTSEGLNNIDDILSESDGIVFSREFLAYELDGSQRYRMTQIQKWVAAKCQQVGKPLYISGGVFQEALVSGSFYESEISDVTNALLDGATGFVLKDCDNIEFTLEVIKAMNDLCCTVEPFTITKTDFWRIMDELKMPINAAEASALSCTAIANQTNARVIVLPTVSGRTAKILMRMRPACLIIAVSTKTDATRLLQTYRCVFPLMYNGAPHKTWYKTVGARVDFAIEYAVQRRWLEYGDTYVTLQRGAEDSSFCDMVRVWTVTISRKALVECPDNTEEELCHFH